MTHPQFQVEAAFDRGFINEAGDSVRHLVVTLRAPRLESDRPRTPLDLGLVIDRSGSMSGERLALAKEAAAGVVERLADDDHLSLVAFDDEVRVLAPATPLSGTGRDRLVGAVGRIGPGGATDLGLGWLTGVETVAAAQDELEGHRHHVIVLSDGKANRGITGPHELARHAAQLRERGVSSSAVGIGDDYSPDQLQAIAEAGGGDLHDAQHAHEIVEVVLGELNSLADTVGDDLRLAITLPFGTRAQLLGGEHSSGRGHHLSVSLGSIGSEVTRTVVLKLTLPGGQRDETVTTRVEASWREPGELARRTAPAVEATLTFGRPPRGGWPLEEAVASSAALRWQGWIVREAIRLNGQGRCDDAVELVASELRWFERYVAGLPEGGRLVHELHRTARTVGRRMNERSRKEVHLAHYKLATARADHRMADRGPWADHLDGE